jgi:hypothetical protein
MVLRGERVALPKGSWVVWAEGDVPTPLTCARESAGGAALVEGGGMGEAKLVGRGGGHADPPAPLASMWRGGGTREVG